MNSADKYDNTKLSKFLLLASFASIGVVIYWCIVFPVAIIINLGKATYPVLMIIIQVSMS